nr:hypothetical protein [Tanacetum cinerariifolium]
MPHGIGLRSVGSLSDWEVIWCGEVQGSTTYSANSLLKEFTDELALITYPSNYDDNRTCDIESDLREIEFLLYQGEDSNFKDSIDQTDLANRDDLFVDPTPKMFTDEQPLDYLFPLRFDVYPDDFFEIESDANNYNDDSFDSNEEKIKESKLLIDKLDLPCDIFPHLEYDSFASQDFSRDDDLPSPDNENKDFDPPFYELLVFKEVPNSMRLLPFLSENEEKVFKPRIYTFKKDTVGFEFGQNRKNQYFGPLVDTGKFHEIPHSYHNKENLVNHADTNYHYNSDCNSIPVHRQMGTVVDNHNHHHAQLEDTNELFQKLLEDLQIIKEELAEYINSLSWNYPTFFYDDEEHYVQYQEYLKKYSDATTPILSTEEPEYLLSMGYNHPNTTPEMESDEIIKSGVEELVPIPNECEVTSEDKRDCDVLVFAPILSTKELEYSPSMGYEHFNTTPETKSDEIIKSGVEELVPILSENEVTLEDKRECDVPVCENSPVCDDHSEIFFDSKNDDDISSDEDDFEDIEYVEASLPDPEIVSVEEENVVQQEAEEVDLEDISQIQDVVLRDKLLSITRLIDNIESLNENPTPDRVFNSFVSIPIFEESDNSLLDNFSLEFETFCDHTGETRSGNTTTHANDSLPDEDTIFDPGISVKSQWFKFFAIKHDQPEDSNELFQKLLEDLKELTEYKESLENSSKEIATSNSNKEKEEPQKTPTFEVKNVVEQPAERGNRSIESLQNFRVIHKSSISLKNTSKISPVHAVAPILSTKELEYSPSMGYEHFNTTPETKLDEIIKSGVEELVPILNDFEDIEYVEASLPDPEIVSVEEENVVQQEEEEVDLEDISQIQDVVLRDKLLSITRLIANIESLNENPTPDHVFNSSVSIPIFEESDNSLLDNFSLEFETFCDHTGETRSGNTTTHANDSLPEYDSFCFKIEPDQERLINVAKNDIFNDSSNDPLLEEADLFLASGNSIPLGIENFADDSAVDIHFLEELLVDDSILSHESSDSNFEDNPSVPLPPPEPPDADFKPETGEDIVMNTIVDFKSLKEFDDDDYSSFIFVIYSKVFSFLLSAESEDTIFDPGISVKSQWYLIGMELSCVFLFIPTLLKAQLRFYFPFALPKDK